MTNTPPTPDQTLISGRYLIKKQLGGGGMGAVYLAHDQTKDQAVALKLLAPPKQGTSQDPKVIQRMQREIKVLMLAEDPRVIALLDWGNDPTYGLFYVMEMLSEAVDLETHLTQRRPAFWERLRLFQECLLGLLALHDIKAIHRDIKPQNILCVGAPEQPSIKWIDPGIAKWFPDDLRTHITVETAHGALLGTPLYMAPEMWMGTAIDARTDIYQCGIMGFEMLVLRRPFVGTLPQLMHQHLLVPMPSLMDFADDLPPGISREALQLLDHTILKATQKSPDDRFQVLSDFCYALQPVWQFAPSSLRFNLPAFTPSPQPSSLLPSGIGLESVIFSGASRHFSEHSRHPSSPNLSIAPVPPSPPAARSVSFSEFSHNPPTQAPISEAKTPPFYLLALLLGLPVLLFALWLLFPKTSSNPSNRHLLTTPSAPVPKMPTPTLSLPSPSVAPSTLPTQPPPLPSAQPETDSSSPPKQRPSTPPRKKRMKQKQSKKAGSINLDSPPGAIDTLNIPWE